MLVSRWLFAGLLVCHLGWSHSGTRRHHHAPSTPAPNPFQGKSSADTGAGRYRNSRPLVAPRYQWYSADMHIHATGCRPETVPTSTTAFLKEQLVKAKTNIGDLLIWGDQQSYVVDAPNFRGHADDPLSDSQTILHWDLEISLLPGHLFGHQTLLNLSDLNLFKPASSPDGIPYPNYPGKNYLLPNYEWARRQQAITGYPHAEDWTAEVYHPGSLGSSIAPRELPLDVVRARVDFLATEYLNDPNYLWLWYSMLNNGIHLAPVAGSDYPCFEGPVGRVQTMFPVAPGNALTFPAYIEAIRNGRTVIKKNGLFATTTGDPTATATTSYLDMRVQGQPLGSEISVPASQTPVTVEVDAAGSGNNQLGIVVNGTIVTTVPLTPALTTYTFQIPFAKSGWVAAITVDAHSAATFVLVNGCDIRLDPVGAAKWADYVRLLAEYLPNRPEIFWELTLANLAWQRIAQEGTGDQCIPRTTR